MESFLPFGEGLYRSNVATVSVALPSDLVIALDDWIMGRPEPHPTREEAIRELLQSALTEHAAQATKPSI
jgi:metal-responsive CopG/Arc/MetJ family transcriptional regulator